MSTQYHLRLQNVIIKSRNIIEETTNLTDLNSFVSNQRKEAEPFTTIHRIISLKHDDFKNEEVKREILMNEELFLLTFTKQEESTKFDVLFTWIK